MKHLNILFLICVVCYSQPDSVESFKLPEMKMERSDKKNTEIYFEEGYHVKVMKDSLLFTFKKINYPVAINNVDKLKILTGSQTLIGAGIGAGAGFILGFIMVAVLTTKDFHSGETKYPVNVGAAFVGGFIVALPFGLIGGLAGALTSNYDEYEFNKMDIAQKKNLLLKAFKKNRIK